MATLKMNELRAIILRSYKGGNEGCSELADEFAEELIQELMAEMAKSKGGGEWKIYTVEEIKKRPLGTLFEHSRLGKGWIDGTERVKTMTFEDGNSSYLMENDEPWNEPIREIGKL